MKTFPILFLISGILVGSNAQAQAVTQVNEPAINAPACFDNDGDGWGWNGSQSCVIPDFVAVAGECIDYDGDGWGWNGVASCQIAGFVSVAGDCIDTDDDGFGWNNIETCNVVIPPLDDLISAEADTVEIPSLDDLIPVETDDNEAARLAFGLQLEGVRSYGCIPGLEGFFTTEYVEVYSNGQLTYDTWLYEEPECVTRPLSTTTALPLENYALENPLLTSDGREAFEIRYETVQLSSDSDEELPPPGSMTFDLVAVEQGGVSIGTNSSSTLEDRPTELTEPFSAAPLGMRAEPASIDGLMHTWSAVCFNGRVRERTFTEQQLFITSEYYADDDCDPAGFIAKRVNTWNITYREPGTSVFGQPVMRTLTELIDSRFTSLVIDSALPAPPELSEVGLIFEDIWAVIDDEIVIGTCLDKRPGGCGSAENIPNLLNLNIGNRFLRQ